MIIGLIQGPKNILLLTSFLALTYGCGTTVEDAKSSKKASTVATEDKEGVVTCTITKDGGTLVASPNSEVADSAMTFGPNSLAVSTEISLGEASDVTDSVMNALSIPEENLLLGSTAPLFVGSSKASELAQPGSIYLPLPSQAELGLTTASSKLVFLYVIYIDGGYKAGVKALTANNLVGAFANVEVKGIGYFQIAYFKDAVEDSEKTVTNISVKLKK